MSYPHRERRRAAELKELRAEVVKQLEQLDFRAENLEQAFAEMARHVERTIRADGMSARLVLPHRSPRGASMTRAGLINLVIRTSDHG